MLLTPNFALLNSITFQFDSGWTRNNHLNTELFCSDDFHLIRKGYEMLSRLFIGKNTLRCQNSKASRNYSEAVLFSIVENQFPPLLSVYQNVSKVVSC